MRKFERHETSEKFKVKMQQIIQYNFNYRNDKVWTNVPEMKNYAKEVLLEYDDHRQAHGIINSDCIPHCMKNVLNQGLKEDDCTKWLKEEILSIVKTFKLVSRSSIEKNKN